jgi:hypothetical protein
MNNEWNAFVTELRQCVAGSRGWVDCSKSRARKLGVAHANLVVAAEALGLKTAPHGRYGWIATRAC